LNKAFQGVKLRQSQVIVNLSRPPVAILGSLPELSSIRAAGKHRSILL
jgi:hypothetical protein